MKSLGKAGDVLFGLMYILLGLLVTALTYGFLYILAYVLLIAPMQGDAYWAHLAGILYVVAATFSVLRTTDDYWTHLRWEAKALRDGAGPEDGPARNFAASTDTQKSPIWVKVFAAFLVPGPQFILTGARELLGTGRRDRMTPAPE